MRLLGSQIFIFFYDCQYLIVRYLAVGLAVWTVKITVSSQPKRPATYRALIVYTTAPFTRKPNAPGQAHAWRWNHAP